MDLRVKKLSIQPRTESSGTVPREILIIKLSAIGDVVHCLAFLNVLRRNYPYANIDWVVEEGAADLIYGHPDIRNVILSRRKSWGKMIREKKTFLTVFKEIIVLYCNLEIPSLRLGD